jgi:FlaA1/EpsC-like NDP-sugar epimerase
MVQDDSQNRGMLTIGEDPRVTRIGRFLRQLKLDELPQLFNVLKGDMSLVGPCPEVPYYVEKFREDYQDVLTVRPGLTDLASLKYIDEQVVLGKAAKPEEEYTNKILPEKIRLEKLYIEHASFAFDLAVIAQTLLQLLGMRSVILKVTDRDSHDEVAFLEGSVAFQLLSKYRRPIIITFDLALIVLANYLAFWLRFDGQIPSDATQLFLKTLPWLIGIRGIVFMIFRLNEGLWRYISIWDLKKILGGVLAGTIAFYCLVSWGYGFTGYPRSIYIIDSILVLIIGAGDAGENIVREMQTHSTSSYTPIGFVDDDLSKVGKRIHGIKVLGTRQDLSRILHVHKTEEVLVALPGTDSWILREITAALAPFNVRIKTLPNLGDILEGKVTISQLRDLEIEDLLQRPPVGLDPQPVRSLIDGKRVLVTGAGGSIGSELCRQIVGLAPKALILYERHENSLYAIAGELADRGHSCVTHGVLGDITDFPRLQEILKTYRPDIIFHSAAHKHVPLMELNSGEAFKNNVLGTRLVAQAAVQFGVEHFVLISTDKAVNPSSVMGATKRVAELVVQDMADRSQTRFLTVRFGNVLGSNGSVVPRFQKQIKAGGPVTVTHPEVRRYFMLIPEAVTLVLQAAALGEQGAIYILEMGGQIKLVDLARNLIRLSGHVPEKNIPIQFIGLRPGEKLEEELVGESERTVPSSVDKILRIQSEQSVDPTFLAQILSKFEDAQVLSHSPSVIELLQQLVPTFHRPDTLESTSMSEEYQIH